MITRRPPGRPPAAALLLGASALAFCALLPIAASASAQGSGPGAAADSSGSHPSPAAEQSTWFDAYKDLKDPTATYTQHYRCKEFTPAGQATLYPYYVPTKGYEFEWRNNSTKGVTVTANSTSTDDMENEGVAFFVTSLHVSGDYALRVSFECQSNDPESIFTVGRPTVADTGADSASIEIPIHDGYFAPQSDKYFLEYGTAAGVYTHRTDPVTTNDLKPKSDATRTVRIAGLQPSTTYHYRAVFLDEQGRKSYSGADQTFTTAPAPDTASPGDETAAGETASSDLLRLSFRDVPKGEGVEIGLLDPADDFLFEPPMLFSSAGEGVFWNGERKLVQVSCHAERCAGDATVASDAAADTPLKIAAVVPEGADVSATWSGGPRTLLPGGGGEFELQPR